MNKNNIKSITPQTVGWVEYKLSDKEMDYVWRCIENKKERFNDKLVGNIDGSYRLMDKGDWFFINVIKPVIGEFEKEFGRLGQSVPLNQAHPCFLNSWWVNYQKQNEFNPVHNHFGLYSFVLWMKIPFNWEKQNRARISQQSNHQSISTFEFHFRDSLGRPRDYSYRLSKEDAGVLLLFPSELLHTVYPFYDCDEDRISVSGNITINTSKLV